MRLSHGFWEATLLLLTLFGLQVGSSPIGSDEPYWPEFLGITPPLFPAPVDDSTTCYKAFQSLSVSSCSMHESDTLPVKVHNCIREFSSGVIVLQRTDDHTLQARALLGSAVYRLRVTGPDGLWLLEVAYCRPDLAMATYDLRSAGRHAVEVLMLYTSFSFAKPNSSIAIGSPWAGFLTMEVQPSPKGDQPAIVHQTWRSEPDETILQPSANEDGHPADGNVHGEQELASLPLCPDNGPLPGRWLFRSWPIRAAAPLLRTCVWSNPTADCSSPRRRPLHLDPAPAGLYWQPHGCRLRPAAGIDTGSRPLLHAARSTLGEKLLRDQQQRVYAGGASAEGTGPGPAPAEPGTCLPPGRHVCFVGDSHLRYLHNSLVMWQRGFAVSVDNSAKQLLDTPLHSSVYVRMLWGIDWPDSEDGAGGGGSGSGALGRNCTDVVVNFGQWPASYRSGPAPFSAAAYLRQLLRVRRAMLRLRAEHGVRVYWLTTCMSSLKSRLESLGVDWRTDPLLLLYNRLATDVMAGTWPGLGPGEGLGEGEERVRDGSRRRSVADAAGSGGEDMEAGGEGGPRLGGEDGRWVGAGAGAGRAAGAGREQEEEEEARHRGGQVRGGAERAREEPGPGALEPRQRPRQQAAGQGHGHRHRHLARRTSLAHKREVRALRRLLRELRGASVGAAASTTAAAAAAAAAPDGVVPLIDTWSATRVLHDTTWDGVHYSNTGAVGLLQLSTLLHALCAESVLAGLRPGNATLGGGAAGSAVGR